MKPAIFKLDRRVFELLKDGDFQQFTIRSLRDAYALLLGGAVNDTDLWRYIYDQVLRLKRVGWVQQDPVRRRRDQIFHVLDKPAAVSLSLVHRRFSNACHSALSEDGAGVAQPRARSETCPTRRLESLAKEIRLDMLSALGEAERYKQLFTEMPVLKARVEDDYIEARDRSSRLLGHLRAIENTLKMLVAA